VRKSLNSMLPVLSMPILIHRALSQVLIVMQESLACPNMTRHVYKLEVRHYLKAMQHTRCRRRSIGSGLLCRSCKRGKRATQESHI
jgi:hypothetical protein